MYRVKIINEATVVTDTGPIDDHDHPMSPGEAVKLVGNLMNGLRTFTNDTPRSVVIELRN